jgi:hypothetical protein
MVHIIKENVSKDFKIGETMNPVVDLGIEGLRN